MEDQAVPYVLEHFDQLPLLSGVLCTVDGKYVGYCMWEELDGVNAIALFSKVDHSYKGLNDFIKMHCYQVLDKKGYMTINIMADVGVENLRAVKKRMRPFTLTKKYKVIWKGCQE